MPDPAPITDGGGESFWQRKIGPLPVWAYAAAGAGVLGYWWWSRRSTGGAFDATTTDGASANGGGGGSTSDQGVPTGSNKRLCRKRRDPAGHRHTVCGHGHWVKGPSGRYAWFEGPIRRFYRPRGGADQPAQRAPGFSSAGSLGMLPPIKRIR